MLVQPTTNVAALIKVVGVGGGGNNAVNTMASDYHVEGVEFIAVNTDAQVLKNSRASIKIQIGSNLTQGLGAGGDPNVGSNAAEESAEELHEALDGSDMVFVTGGMGGGTGTGAIPVISGISKNLGALTVAVVTKPFAFEGKKRMETALEGISKLKDKTDAMIVVPNQRILEIIDRNLTFPEAMKKVDEVLANAVISISNLVTQTGFINLDFADVRSILKNSGTAMMGIGEGTGENRAEMAAKQAISNALLEMSIQGAKGVLFNVLGGGTLTMQEVASAAQLITDMVDPSAVVKFGASIDDNMGDRLQITVLAAGFPDNVSKAEFSMPKPAMQPAAAGAVGEMKTPAQINASLTDKAPKKPDQPIQPALDDDELEIPAFLRRKN